MAQKGHKLSLYFCNVPIDAAEELAKLLTTSSTR